MVMPVHQKPRVLLADDHVIVAQGFEALLKPNFDVVGSVRDGRALVAAVDELHPDLVITSISMPGLNGLEAIRQIRKSWAKLPLIVLTVHVEPSLVAEALKAGANGYVLKTSPMEELEFAIREVMLGRTYVTSVIAKDVYSLLMQPGGSSSGVTAQITARQREVLQLVAEGRTMKEIAAILNISPRTAESHKYEMMSMLGIQTTAELIHYAIKLKLVSE
jgi:DNA-binding NarL/FixJ family response regulator